MEKQHSGSVMQEIRKNGLLLIPLTALFLVVICFEIVPAVSIIITSFMSDDGPTLLNYVKSFTDHYYLLSMKNSVVLSLICALFGVIIGTIAALCIKNGVRKNVSEKLLTITNMTNNFAGVPLAFAFIILLGNSGLVTLFFKNILKVNLYEHGFDLYSWGGITLIYIYFEIPLAIMLMFPAVGLIKKQFKDAAKVLGANNATFWFKVGIPMLIPPMIGTFCILFANSLGAYATAYALVANDLGILAVNIGCLVSGDAYSNPYLACTLSTILGGILMILLFVKGKMFRTSE